MRHRIGGHLWTIAPALRDAIAPSPMPPSEPWSTTVPDPHVGEIRLGGRLHHEPGADTLVLVVHGLGGSSDSPYARRAAAAARRSGFSSLRLDLRGADERGEDVYHAALAEDLEHALAEAACARYQRVLVIGYSLGGHVALWLARRGHDPRVVAVAAVCAPVDLARSSADIDRGRAWAYRHYVLSHLKRAARRVSTRRPLPAPIDEIDRVRTIREWDARVVAPRHGFVDVDDYYARASVGPHLGQLAVPALWIGARHDPMVTAASVEGPLAAAAGRVEVRWLQRGGHVGFPEDATRDGSVEAAVLRWLVEQG